MNKNTAYVLIFLGVVIFLSIFYICTTVFNSILILSYGGEFVFRFEMDDNTLQAINFTTIGSEKQ